MKNIKTTITINGAGGAYLRNLICKVFDLDSGDIFLLCSGCLTDMVWEEEMTGVLAEQTGPFRQAEELVQLALDSGGRDNVTVIVIQIQ